ncbi:MAG: SIR2 family protein [Rhodospirillales bacterium]|nr:SIR2 family protein [Rhodospirillales bacterium]
MWLLGAGGSAAAGIPTAWDLIWHFKRELYISKRRVARRLVEDLGNPAVRRSIESFIDSLGQFPPADAPDEYAALFEAAYPSEADRRTLLESKIRGAKPSYGHIALATLMRADRARCVWTTNFDPLLADACAKVYDGTGFLTTVALDAPGLAEEVINEERWPVEIKLHGDFRSRRLKNSSEELRTQDAHLRRLLVAACGRSGLVVVGYSGRDDSVMDALEEALEGPTPFPGGLFWLHRGLAAPLPRVRQLLKRAATAGVDGGLVPIESFDEVMQDLIRQIPGLNTSALDAFAARSVVSDAPKARGSRSYPVLRLNAIEVAAMPSVCRVVDCAIGGHADVRDAVAAVGAAVVATRVRAGVLAFGADAAVRRTFEPFGIKTFDLYALHLNRMRVASQERGLLRDALTRALARERGLAATRRGAEVLLTPADPEDPQWAPLRGIVGELEGTLPSCPEVAWREGVSTRLDWADGRLWLLFEPRTVFDGVTAGSKAAATDFARERTARRYNRVLSQLISFWAALLAGDGREMRAFGDGANVDAVFRLGTRPAFSGRTRE